MFSLVKAEHLPSYRIISWNAWLGVAGRLSGGQPPASGIGVFRVPFGLISNDKIYKKLRSANFKKLTVIVPAPLKRGGRGDAGRRGPLKMMLFAKVVMI